MSLVPLALGDYESASEITDPKFKIAAKLARQQFLDSSWPRSPWRSTLLATLQRYGVTWENEVRNCRRYYRLVHTPATATEPKKTVKVPISCRRIRVCPPSQTDYLRRLAQGDLGGTEHPTEAEAAAIAILEAAVEAKAPAEVLAVAETTVAAEAKLRSAARPWWTLRRSSTDSRQLEKALRLPKRLRDRVGLRLLFPPGYPQRLYLLGLREDLYDAGFTDLLSINVETLYDRYLEVPTLFYNADPVKIVEAELQIGPEPPAFVSTRGLLRALRRDFKKAKAAEKAGTKNFRSTLTIDAGRD